MPVQAKINMPAIRAKPLGRRSAMSAWNLQVLEYLQQCLDLKRRIAIITGTKGSGKSMLLRRFLHYSTEGPIAYAKNLDKSPHEFLESILLQFGFETFDSSLSELRNLTMVFVRHEASKGCRPVVVVEDAQNCSASVLNLIQMLTRLDIDGESALLFILTGTSNLRALLKAKSRDESCDLNDRNAIPVTPRKLNEHPVGRLKIRRGEKLLSQRTVDQRQILIGRKEQNDICLKGRFVSRNHAVLISEPTGVYIVDLKSTNGICVNGQRVRRQALVNGDIVSIGDYQLQFTDARGKKSTPATESDSDDISQTVAMRRQPMAPLGGLRPR